MIRDFVYHLAELVLGIGALVVAVVGWVWCRERQSRRYIRMRARERREFERERHAQADGAHARAENGVEAAGE